jgi:hypothetical protein
MDGPMIHIVSRFSQFFGFGLSCQAPEEEEEERLFLLVSHLSTGIRHDMFLG